MAARVVDGTVVEGTRRLYGSGRGGADINERAGGPRALSGGRAERVEAAREERGGGGAPTVGKGSYRNGREEPVGRLGSIPPETSRCAEWDSPPSWKGGDRRSFTAPLLSWDLGGVILLFLPFLAEARD